MTREARHWDAIQEIGTAKRGLLSLATGSCIGYTTGSFQGKGSGETSLFSQLISTLVKGDLLLADRYYTTYAIMAMMIDKEIPLVFRQRANVKRDLCRLG